MGFGNRLVSCAKLGYRKLSLCFFFVLLPISRYLLGSFFASIGRCSSLRISVFLVSASLCLSSLAILILLGSIFCLLFVSLLCYSFVKISRWLLDRLILLWIVL